MMAVIKLTKPPKPVSQMTDAERRAYAQEVYDAMRAQRGGK